MALVLVTIHAMLVLSAWSVANRRMVGVVALRSAMEAHEAGRREPTPERLGLAYGLALLETGLPPTSPFDCYIDVAMDPRSPDVATGLRVTFTIVPPDQHQPGSGKYGKTWKIEVHRVEPGQHAPVASLPVRPPGG